MIFVDIYFLFVNCSFAFHTFLTPLFFSRMHNMIHYKFHIRKSSRSDILKDLHVISTDYAHMRTVNRYLTLSVKQKIERV